MRVCGSGGLLVRARVENLDTSETCVYVCVRVCVWECALNLYNICLGWSFIIFM